MSLQESVLYQLLQKYVTIMKLNIFVDSSDEELKMKYLESSKNHNMQILKNDFPNAGFDLFLPFVVTPTTSKIDHQIKCSASMVYADIYQKNIHPINTGYYMYPRSSISKTPYRLANSVGIIDSGYRGNLIAMVDYDTEIEKKCTTNEIEQYGRLFQICAPGLVPIYVNIVDKLENLGETTKRGAGGFGSTGV